MRGKCALKEHLYRLNMKKKYILISIVCAIALGIIFIVASLLKPSPVEEVQDNDEAIENPIEEYVPSQDFGDMDTDSSADATPAAVPAAKPTKSVANESADKDEAEWTASETVGGVVEFDKLIHDFGDVAVSDGKLTCFYKFRNISDKPIAVYEISSSCGCTTVNWTKEPVLPGKTGSIKAVFDNEDGPNSFDKTLTAYISGLDKPVILHMRGVVHPKSISLQEAFGANRIGDLGVKELKIRIGNIEQGQSKSNFFEVANLGGEPIFLDFKNISPNLSISVSTPTIAPKAKARVNVSIRSDRSIWGRNSYFATPLVNGEEHPESIFEFVAVTKENFADWTDEEIEKSSRPQFVTHTANAGTIKKGERGTVSFSFENKGESDFVCYRAQADIEGVDISPIPATERGKKGSISISFDSSKLKLGDNHFTVSLFTNSPYRPLIDLNVLCIIE